MFLFLVMLCVKMAYVASLDCYQCENLEDPASCLAMVVCPSDSLCAMDMSTVGGQSMYNMSCKPKQACHSTSVLSTTFSPAPVVDRRRQATDEKHCTECCSINACNKLLCFGSDINGGWSAWGSWGECSVTCNGGIQHRIRRCDNPVPSTYGRACIGNDETSQACNYEICPDYLTPVVAFKARNVANLNPARYDRIRYDTTIVNIGGAYSTDTGYFTAPYNGLYSFTVHVCTYARKSVYINIYTTPGGAIGMTQQQFEYDGVCSSGNAVANLEAGDLAWIQYSNSGSGNVLYQTEWVWNSFTGMLVHRTP